MTTLFARTKEEYRGGAKYWTIVQYLLLVFTIFEVLGVRIHGGNELEPANCN
jgi:nitrate reductase NapE component